MVTTRLASASAFARTVLNRQLTVIPAGDSITTNNSTFANGNWQFTNSFINAAIFKAGPRFRIIRNAGISGNTSAQLLARFQADVLDHNPDIVPIMIGTNDLPNTASSIAHIAPLMANIETMVLMALAAGALPVLMTPPARDGNYQVPLRKAIPFYYRLAAAYRVPLIDMFAITVDPATGAWKSGYSTDGTHPNSVGIAAMADYLAPILKNIASFEPRPYLAAVAETSSTAADRLANIVRNGNFAVQTTPGAPDNWTIANTGNHSYTATTDAPASFTGKELVWTKSASGQVNALSCPQLFHGAAVGDVLEFSGSLGISDLGAVTNGVNMMLESSQSGLRTLSAWRLNGDYTFCAPMVLQAGNANYLGPQAQLTTDAAGTYKLRNITVINRTQLDAIWMPANGR